VFEELSEEPLLRFAIIISSGDLTIMAATNPQFYFNARLGF
jgi:hypothetical protein